MARPQLRITALLAIAAVVTGCSDDGPFEIETVREIEKVDERELIERTHRDRFALALPKEDRERPPPPPRPTWAFDLPEGWRDKGASGMRVVSLEVPGDPAADVGAFLLPMSPMLDNVNRWRDQMGQEPVKEDALTAMAYEWRGQEAVYVDLEGTFQGMGSPGGEGQRFLGLLAPHEGMLFSVKLVGPKSLVSANEAKFKALLQSLRPGASDSAPSEQPEKKGLRATLQWDTPAGWSAERARGGMRIASFRLAAAPDLDVRIIGLMGDGGGIAMNARRWAGQAGAGELTDAQLDELPRIPLLGTEAVLCEFEGKSTLGGEAEVEAMALGLICLLGEESLFVYVLGPKETVAPHKAAFVSLCRSLRLEE